MPGSHLPSTPVAIRSVRDQPRSVLHCGKGRPSKWIDTKGPQMTSSSIIANFRLDAVYFYV